MSCCGSSEVCVFCNITKISKERILYDADGLVAFPDISPAAKYHFLIIPKEHIVSAKHLSSDHLQLLYKMRNLALETLLPQAGVDVTKPDTFRLGFHLPPFTTVPHLHLHVLVLPFKGWRRFKYRWSWNYKPLGTLINELEIEARSDTQQPLLNSNL